MNSHYICTVFTDDDDNGKANLVYHNDQNKTKLGKTWKLKHKAVGHDISDPITRFRGDNPVGESRLRWKGVCGKGEFWVWHGKNVWWVLNRIRRVYHVAI